MGTKFSLLQEAKQMITRLRLAPPGGIKAGKNVRIHRPRHRIEAPEHITIGDGTTIGSNPLIVPILEYGGVRYDPRITIGQNVYIGPNLYMVATRGISIGDGCVLSESVFLNDNSHGFDPEAGLIMNQPLTEGGQIQIGEGSFLGLRSAIMPGVTLGEHCVVGINSVVTKSFPAYSMLGGAPARLIRRYCREQKAWLRP